MKNTLLLFYPFWAVLRQMIQQFNSRQAHKRTYHTGIWEYKHTSTSRKYSTSTRWKTTPTFRWSSCWSNGYRGIHERSTFKSKDAQSTALCPNCDIFIVTLCSLRKDHVSAYGEISNLTPSIDKIAKEGAVFTKTYAASSFTFSRTNRSPNG